MPAHCSWLAPRWLAAIVATLVVLALCSGVLDTGFRKLWERPIEASRNVLVVTAHPDDETIFFSPTILSLRRQQQQVHLLCFTTGDFHGLGDTRVVELVKAAAALQIDEQHLVIVNDSRINDGKREVWPTYLLAAVIAQEVAARNIDTVVTFDDRGVYGHPNHIACAEGVRMFAEACARQQQPALASGSKSHFRSTQGRHGTNPGAGTRAESCPSAWRLHTESARRSMGALSGIRLAAACPSSHHACYVSPSRWRTVAAMLQHTTQWRWWGHLLSTPYTFANSLDQISTTLPATMPSAGDSRPNNSARRTRLLRTQGMLDLLAAGVKPWAHP